jgi:Nucleoside-diphosphate-sugar epimerases
MKILVIGGTYFLGRIFTMKASKQHQLTLLNRGQYSMKEYGVNEYHFDRHDISSLSKIKDEYDVIVDFCAYQKDDIKTILDYITTKHYIFISTCDVYIRDNQYKDETAPLNHILYQGEVGEYINNKVLLENELVEECLKHNVYYTSLRPANIYGPFNYAPRESIFIEMLVQRYPFIQLSDNDGEFQLVYVKDVVKAIIKVIENKAYNKVYNIVAKEKMNYQKFYKILEEVSSTKIQYITLSSNEAIEHQYPLPYPIYKEETQLYNGDLIQTELNLQYTPIEIGMKETYEAFLPVFKKD